LEFVKVFGALLLTLAAFYLLLRLLKRRILPQKGLIEMFYYQAFGPRRGIAVIKIVDEYMAVGIGDQSISLLSKLKGEEKWRKGSGEQLGTENIIQKNKPGWLRRGRNIMASLFLFLVTLHASRVAVFAQAARPAAAPGGAGLFGLSTPLELLLFLTLLSILPAILVMVTSFTRVVIVLSFLRQALGTPTVPPTQVILGLALFITFFIMSPTIDRIYAEAYQPYSRKEIGAEEALNRAGAPLKEFMLRQTKEKELAFFLKMSKAERPAKPMDLSMRVVIPAFAIGELKKAFEIGFLIFLPFIVIDMVVASVLLSMGMMMLPPVMISMPFKLLLFVLVDGWQLLIGSLIAGFR
jgi:flagellar biosynthetic protein FliP